VLGDFDLAEEALHDAFRAAVEQWPAEGMPANPRAWLVSAGRFKAIDGIRRRTRFEAAEAEIADRLYATSEAEAPWQEEELEDDRLRLIFTCCHPALPPEARIALTLREVCGLSTEEIARAYLTTPPTLAQRIVRAKAKIKAAGIPYEVPPRDALAERLDSVLHVIYLVFNEGYAASSGASLTRHDLSAEAIRLGRLLVELLPEPEAMGLLALMLLHESRRFARVTAEGDLVLLDAQDRSRWDPVLIAEGVALVTRALSSRRIGPYALQAGHRGSPCECPDCGGDRLGGDRRLVRCACPGRTFAGHRTESRRRGGHARRARGGARAHRWLGGAGPSGGLPPDARGPRRLVPAPRPSRRGPGGLSARPCADAARTGAPLPARAAARTGVLKPCRFARLSLDYGSWTDIIQGKRRRQ
jgi:RNA polymerase sigma factor (sigma-70 family)